MMSTSPNPDASVFAGIMELHFKNLHLIPEQLLLNKEEMLPILQKCFSLTFLKEGLAEQIAVHKSDSAHRINPSPLDSALLKDCVAQVLVASNKRFIKIVHCYLLEAGKEKQAEEYLQKVSPASRVQHLDSIKMWNYLTLPFQVFKVMEDMGLGANPSTFFMPPAPPEDEAGIVPETEDSTSTAVEPNPVGLVLHVGEVTDRSIIDTAAEQT
ncbi:unnamed protein product [Prunus armeniaca]|uniref:Uncharacterized protein n=1 Tax=Prunus armeniaca TaxID=36596 RepID=A0A6J5U385_PRUAR|nr:unnamed protein product [Prunus armeniaca]